MDPRVRAVRSSPWPLMINDACRSRLKRLSTRASEGHRVNPQSPRAPAAQVEHSGLVSLV